MSCSVSHYFLKLDCWAAVLVVSALVGYIGVDSAYQPDVLRLGVLYDESQTSEEEQLLLRAVDSANFNASDIEETSSPTEGLRTPHLSVVTERLKSDDVFHSAKKVCHLIEQGVLAVFGSRQPASASLARTACSRHRVPHIYLDRDHETELPPDSVSLTLSPSPYELGLALRDLVAAQQWSQFTLVYEHPEALVRLRAILELSSPRTGQPIPVSLKLLPQGMAHRPVLRDIAKSGDSNIVLDVSAQRLGDILRYAQKIGMVTEYHNYVVTTLDLHTVDLSDFQNSHTNLTGFQLLNRELWEQDSAARETYAKKGIYPLFLRNRAPRRPLTVDAALAQDALELLVRAVRVLALTRSLKKPVTVRCHSNPTSRPWTQSRMLVETIKKVPFSGLTGPVHLDPFGRRHNLSLNVVQLKRAGLTLIGAWSSDAGLTITRTGPTLQNEILHTLHNKTFQITTLINAPYVMLKESREKLRGNDRFEGFCVDLVRDMADLLGFRYELRLVRDGAYGRKDSRGRWNGMIRELVDREADLALADLTITYLRDEVVDFTTPFMNLGISILFRKTQGEQSFFFFLTPLSPDVWLCTALSYVGISVLLYLVSRFGSGEPDAEGLPRGEDSRLRNRFTLLNSFWFTISAITQQGSDSTPRSASARVIVVVWWFFSFVIISSYTANLASFLTRERLRPPIETAEDLAKQSEIQYGCVRSGSTEAFFKESKFETYERMWQAMSSSLTDSNAEGVQRVLKGGYAFLMESTSIEYVVERHCELTQIGGLLDPKNYGIAMPSGSPYRSLLSSAILRLQENGRLQALKRRWWQARVSQRCHENDNLLAPSKSGSTASELGLPKVGGAFVMLLGGLGTACVIVFAEFIWKARSTRVTPSPKHEIVASD